MEARSIKREPLQSTGNSQRANANLSAPRSHVKRENGTPQHLSQSQSQPRPRLTPAQVSYTPTPQPIRRPYCYACARPLVGQPRKCGTCDKAAYCSRTCQRKDWPRHHREYCSRGMADPGPLDCSMPGAWPSPPQRASNSSSRSQRHPKKTDSIERRSIKREPVDREGERVQHVRAPHARVQHTRVRPQTGNGLGIKTKRSRRVPGAYESDAGDSDADSEALNDEMDEPQMRQLVQSIVDLPPIDIPPEERERTPRKLACQLLPHQQVGLTWLLRQERSEYCGGILADTMGIGKTIQALALILVNPSNNLSRKTTLIVAPRTLLRQWEREIDEKVRPGHKLKTKIYHGTHKKGMTVARLLSYDVVLTTYGTAVAEFQLQEKKCYDKLLLLQPHCIFHRIILDEAHNIKNWKSKAAKAFCLIQATYRLCMTGTPMMNNTAEIFSLIRFLGITPYDSWDKFRVDFDHPIRQHDETGIKRLRTFLRSILLQRTQKSKLDGKPILELPELTTEITRAEFDQDQMNFYQALEHQTQVQFNKYVEEGTVLRNYSNILVLLLRLRQCCDHPHLIRDYEIPEGVKIDSKTMIRLARRLDRAVVERIKATIEFHCPLCTQKILKPCILYPCGHYLCGPCLTGFLTLPESAGDGVVHETPCPSSGCTGYVDGEQVICYRYFAEAYGITLRADDSSDSEAAETQESEDTDADGTDVDDTDADDRGNLKDFVVSDDGASEDEEAEVFEEEEEDEKDAVEEEAAAEENDAELIGEDQDDVPKDERTKDPETAQEDEGTGSGSDSDISLPSIEELYARIRGQPKDKNNDNSNAAPREAEPHSSGAKRKRARGTAVAKPVKKMRKGKSRGQARVTDRKRLTLADLKRESLRSKPARERYIRRLRKGWEPSAKTDKAMELLNYIRTTYPNEKTLVFSQWTSFLDLIEIPIHDQGYEYTRLDGTMSNSHRDMAVHDFMSKPELKVMLLSLKAGNAGLNLYSATRVIILDPFWNPSIEDQAIGRAHRLGQRNPVTVYRVLILGTVEDRILELQDRKRNLVNAVLSEKAVQRQSALSVSDIAGLFGLR